MLRKLDARAIDGLYASLLARTPPLSASSVRRVHAVISAALAQAVKWGEIAVNPASKASPPSVPRSQQAAPTPDEVRAMLAYADLHDPDMATYIALAAVTGARRGELLALRWGDVDLEAGLLTIGRSVSVVHGEWIFKGTKTDETKVLALGAFGDAVLRRHRARHEALAAEIAVELTADTPILTYDLVKPISPDTVSHYVPKIAEAVGVRTNPKALRHFAATQLHGAGVDSVTVANRLGHRNVSTTLAFYSHPLPELDLRAAETLGELLAPPAGRG
jgi:integrase